MRTGHSVLRRLLASSCSVPGFHDWHPAHTDKWEPRGHRYPANWSRIAPSPTDFHGNGKLSFVIIIKIVRVKLQFFLDYFFLIKYILTVHIHLLLFVWLLKKKIEPVQVWNANESHFPFIDFDWHRSVSDYRELPFWWLIMSLLCISGCATAEPESAHKDTSCVVWS